jgi:uncharacterized protein YggT (Ycf19 family)
MSKFLFISVEISLVELVLSVILQILGYILRTYMYLQIASSVLRLVRADESMGIINFIHTICDPPARWLRKKFPALLIKGSSGYIDISPLVVLLALGCMLIVIERVGSALRFAM